VGFNFLANEEIGDVIEEENMEFNISLNSDEIQKQQLDGKAPKKSEEDESRERAQAGGSVNRATQRFTRATTMKQSEVIAKSSFNIIKKLGEGSYATVYLVEKKDTLKKYGMKVLEKARILKYGKI